MMERLCRSPTINFARERTARCADMVFWGTSTKRANSPAGTPSGSRATNSRNVSSRVDWASAAKAAMTSVSSIHPDYQIFGTLQVPSNRTIPDETLPSRAIPRERIPFAQRPVVSELAGAIDHGGQLSRKGPLAWPRRDLLHLVTWVERPRSDAKAPRSEPLRGQIGGEATPRRSQGPRRQSSRELLRNVRAQEAQDRRHSSERGYWR